MEKQRIQYWDMAKGLAILLVVIGHAENVNLYLRGVIFSFHIPFFFIANGYFIKDYKIKTTLRKSAKSLLIPYAIICLLSAILYTAVNFCDVPMGNVWNFYVQIVGMFMGMSKSSTIFTNVYSVWLVWFVICLFAARNLYVIIMKGISRLKLVFQILIIAAISVAGIVIGEKVAFLPWSLDVALVALAFLMVGNYLAKYKLFEKKFWLIMLISGIVWIVPLCLKVNIELAARSYPLGYVSVIEAIGGSIFVAGIFYFLEHKGINIAPLSWLGRNSIVILGVHCLEMMYFDWDGWIFDHIQSPLINNWVVILIIKLIFIILVSWIVVIVKNKVKAKVKSHVIHNN